MDPVFLTRKPEKFIRSGQGGSIVLVVIREDILEIDQFRYLFGLQVDPDQHVFQIQLVFRIARQGDNGTVASQDHIVMQFIFSGFINGYCLAQTIEFCHFICGYTGQHIPFIPQDTI